MKHQIKSTYTHWTLGKVSKVQRKDRHDLTSRDPEGKVTQEKQRTPIKQPYEELLNHLPESLSPPHPISHSPINSTP